MRQSGSRGQAGELFINRRSEHEENGADDVVLTLQSSEDEKRLYTKLSKVSS